MTTAREASPVRAQPVEILRREQNTFLSFIEENKDLFASHSSLTYELRDMEEGWRTSSEVGLFVDEATHIGLSLGDRGNTNRQIRRAIDKEIEKTRNRITQFIFSNQTERREMIDKYRPLVFSGELQTPETIKLSEALGKKMDEFRKSFQEERRSVTGPLRESKMELMKKFEDFLLHDSSSLFAVQNFISDRKNRGEIEAIRPFLSSLVESEQGLIRDAKEGIFRRAAKKWTDELKERPMPVIDEFVTSIKSPNMLEWLRLAAAYTPIKTPHVIEEREGDLIKNIASFLKSHPDVSTWPSELRKELASFVASKYFRCVASIERDLDQFKRPVKKIPPKLVDLKIEKELKVSTEIHARSTQRGKNGIEEKNERQNRPIGILLKGIDSYNSIRHLEEDGLSIFLQRAASDLSSNPKMVEDLNKIVANLRQSPYGPGTKKLTGMSVGIGNKSFSLRSIDPRKRIGLSLDDPEFYKIRVVYVIHGNGKDSIIGIEGIYKHDDYMSKYGS